MNELTDKFMNTRKFTMMIEHRVKSQRVTYLEALADICDEEGIDEKEVPKLLLPSIVDKIRAEAINFNYIKGGNVLPV